MPISNDRSILFVHIPKNAGKSIETALDICSSVEQEQTRWRSLPNRTATFLQRLTADKRAAARLWGIIDVALTAQHLTYCEIALLGLVDQTALAKMIKVAVCRNPYDRAVSTFHHMRGKHGLTPAGFEAFWREWPETEILNHDDLAHRRNQWEYCVGLDGATAMDYTLRYETLENDFRAFARAVLKKEIALPWHGKNRGSRAYQDFYNEASQQMIKLRYARDFEFFGYSDKL